MKNKLRIIKKRVKRLPSNVEEKKEAIERAAQEEEEKQRLQTEAEEKQREKEALETIEQELTEALELLRNTKPEKRINTVLANTPGEQPRRFLRRIVETVNDDEYSPDTIVCLASSIGGQTEYRLYIGCRTKGLQKIVLDIIEGTKLGKRLHRCKDYPYIKMRGTRQDEKDKSYIAQKISSGLTEFAH